MSPKVSFSCRSRPERRDGSRPLRQTTSPITTPGSRPTAGQWPSSEVGRFRSGIYLVPAEGGEPRPLVTDNSFAAGLDWTSDGREIIFSAMRLGNLGLYALWRVPVVGGEPEMLAIGEEGSCNQRCRDSAP